MINKVVTVIVDRPIGSTHPIYNETYYPINYGYIKGTMALDNEEQDAYILGIDKPIKMFTGKVIAIIHRFNDKEDKWIVAPISSKFTEEEIYEKVYFIEKYFDFKIIMK